MKLTLLLSVLLAFSRIWGQHKLETSSSIGDCTGSAPILQTGSYTLQFPGASGTKKDFAAYPSISGLNEKNTIWLSFKAPFDGRLTFSAAFSTEEVLNMIVFENETRDICDDISKGKAEIRRLAVEKSNKVGLDLVTSKNVLYPIDMLEGKTVMICLLAAEKSKGVVETHFNFEPTDGELKSASAENGKIVDVRKERSEPALSVLVRDVETGNPVVANISITGLKDVAALYNASDLFMNVERSGKLQFKVDAEGYFFVDREEPVSAGSDNELVIWLEPLGEGKSMQIDEIEFYPGTSEFLSTAEPKLKRLRDFLVLNANVKIEIQGHVHAMGENTLAGQKLSEARAKRVVNYLVDNGIDKSRLSSIGFGNTKPIFENPKFAYEEQANRRVEIKVL